MSPGTRKCVASRKLNVSQPLASQHHRAQRAGVVTQVPPTIFTRCDVLGPQEILVGCFADGPDKFLAQAFG